MKKMIFSIILMSMLFGMGGAVLANTLDPDQKAAIDNNVQQMIDKCRVLMGGEAKLGEDGNVPPCHVETPKDCLVEGADKVVD